MSLSVCAFNHKEWKRLGLQDYAEFAERVSECNVANDGEHGEWFYFPDEPLPNGDWVIYHGSWENDNAPGASMYTHAEIFDSSDPDETTTYYLRCQHWESEPERCESELFSDDEW